MKRPSPRPPSFRSSPPASNAVKAPQPLAAILESILLGLALGASVQAREFFVAPDGDDAHAGTHEKPWATLAGARGALRKLPATERSREPITVWLRGGRYLLTSPVVFEPRDSGSAEAPITYAAYPGETAILDGGQRISGWEVQPDGRWVTQLDNRPRYRRKFRQLYINGQERRRARIPNEGFLRVAGCPEGTPKTVSYHKDCRSFEFAPGDIRLDWHNVTDVEVIVYHFWTDSHLPIQRVDEKKHLVTFLHKAGKVFTDDFSEDGARYIVENVREGLDAPGEWYLDRWTSVLEYLPLPGETPDKVETVAPLAKALLELRGLPSKRQPVTHLRFRNLTFQYTDFQLMIGNANDRQGASSIPAAITLTGAEHCRFEHCRVRRLGNWAFELKEGCRDNAFVGNEIAHVAAGGIRVNGGTAASSPLTHTANNLIADNHLHHYGEDYPSAVGILLQHTFGNVVAHNHLHHGWYSGISVGWVWGYGRSISRDNQIEFNHIHDIGQGLLSDMGGIYTLGVSPGTTLRNNLIHDIEANRYGGWGIYNDAGSSDILIESNVVYRTKFAGYNLNYARNITVRNNVFALGRLEQIRRNRAEPHSSVWLQNNIVYWRTGDLFAGRWQDVPHEEYLGPNQRRVKTRTTFHADWNLYFNPDRKLAEVRLNDRTWDAWRKAGKDTHSLYTDPGFVDVARHDFRLKPDSPAYRLGFHPIDLSTVGPRGTPGPMAR